MADIKWIKISTDIFENKKLRLIRKMPNGDLLALFWIQLLTLAGETNDDGFVYVAKDIPLTSKLIADCLLVDEDIVESGLHTFIQFNMIELVDGLIHIKNWEKYQNVDGMERIREQNRERQRIFKQKRKTLLLTTSPVIDIDESLIDNVTDNVTLTLSNATDKDKEKDKEYEQDKEKDYKDKPSNICSCSKKPVDNVVSPVNPKSFELFWREYPKKTNKGQAIKAWNALNPSEELIGEISESLIAHKRSESWLKENGRYIPLASTFLRAQGWLDEVIPSINACLGNDEVDSIEIL